MNGTELADAFVMCGVLYGLESATERDSYISFAFDLYRCTQSLNPSHPTSSGTKALKLTCLGTTHTEVSRCSTTIQWMDDSTSSITASFSASMCEWKPKLTIPRIAHSDPFTYRLNTLSNKSVTLMLGACSGMSLLRSTRLSRRKCTKYLLEPQLFPCYRPFDASKFMF